MDQFVTNALDSCLKGIDTIGALRFSIPSTKISLETATDAEKANRANFEVAFYKTFKSLEEKFNEINDLPLTEEEKIQEMSDFLKTVHLSDKKVEEQSNLLDCRDVRKNLEFMENGWAHRLCDKLLHSLVTLPPLLDAIEKGEMQIPAEEDR